MISDSHDGGKLSLRKKNKFKNKSDFDFVKEKGHRYSDAFFTMLVVSLTGNPAETMRFGVICSRKFHKRAVVRNRARRIISEAIRLIRPQISPCRILIIPRRGIFPAKMPEVQARIANVLQKAGCLTPSRSFVSPSPFPESC